MPKPKTEKKAKTEARPVLYPEVEARLHLGKDALTAAQARELLGWTTDVEAVKEAKARGVPVDPKEPMLLDIEGNGVWCLHNVGNRDFVEPHARALAQDVLNRCWADGRNGGKTTLPYLAADGRTVEKEFPELTTNGETVIIGRTGKVLSAQHRLAGLVIAGEEWAGPRKDHWVEKGWAKEPSIECILVVGVSEDDRVVRTLDNVRPRTLGDVLSTTGALKGVGKAEERKDLVRLLEFCVRGLWDRTHAKDDPFEPYRTHSESLDFIARHPKVKQCVKHVWDEYNSKADGEEGSRLKANKGFFPPGAMSAFLYLAGSSATHPDDSGYYDRDKPNRYRDERALDWSLWDKAKEFVTLIATTDKKVAVVREAVAALVNTKDGRGATQAHRWAVLCRAWQEFSQGHRLDLKYVLPAHETDADGDHHLTAPGRNVAGGVDQGPVSGKGKPEPTAGEAEGGNGEPGPDDPTPEQIAEATAPAPEEGDRPVGKTRGEQLAELRALHPGRLMLFKRKDDPNDPRWQCWGSDAIAVAKVIGLNRQKDKETGLAYCIFPDGGLKDVTKKLQAAGHEVSYLTEVNGMPQVKPAPGKAAPAVNGKPLPTKVLATPLNKRED